MADGGEIATYFATLELPCRARNEAAIKNLSSFCFICSIFLCSFVIIVSLRNRYLALVFADITLVQLRYFGLYCRPLAQLPGARSCGRLSILCFDAGENHAKYLFFGAQLFFCHF